MGCTVHREHTHTNVRHKLKEGPREQGEGWGIASGSTRIAKVPVSLGRVGMEKKKTWIMWRQKFNNKRSCLKITLAVRPRVESETGHQGWVTADNTDSRSSKIGEGWWRKGGMIRGYNSKIRFNQFIMTSKVSCRHQWKGKTKLYKSQDLLMKMSVSDWDWYKSAF